MNRSHCPVFVQNSREKYPYLCVHIGHSNGGKIFVSVVLIISHCCSREKYPFLYVQTDLLHWKKTCVYIDIHFEGCFCKPPFLCGDSVNSHKNGDFDLRFGAKMEQCERSIKSLILPITLTTQIMHL